MNVFLISPLIERLSILELTVCQLQESAMDISNVLQNLLQRHILKMKTLSSFILLV